MFPEDYEALWKNNRADVLAWWIENKPTTRPSQWWKYDAPEKRHLQESQAAYLQRTGLLTAEELRHLAKYPELLEPEEIRP